MRFCNFVFDIDFETEKATKKPTEGVGFGLSQKRSFLRFFDKHPFSNKVTR